MTTTDTQVFETSPGPGRHDEKPRRHSHHGHHTAGCRGCGARLFLSSVDDVVDSLAGGVICWLCDQASQRVGF